MKTLFQQLKPEFLEKLNEEFILYPSVTERTITELKWNLDLEIFRIQK